MPFEPRRSNQWWRRVTLAVAAVAGAAGCGSPSTPTPATSMTSGPRTPASTSDFPYPPIETNSPLALVAVDPASGSELVTDYGSDVTAQFQITLAESLPEAKVWFELLDEAGAACSLRISDSFPITKNVTTQAVVRMGMTPPPFGWNCAVPGSIVTLRARVTTTVPAGGGRIVTHTHASGSWPLAYSTRRYPPPPIVPPHPTRIASLRWYSNVMGCNTVCFPLWDEFLFGECIAKAGDGDAVTTAITIQWDNGRMDAGSRAFPAGATSSVNGAIYEFGAVNGPKLAPARSAVIQCTVTNSRGHVVQQTIQAR